MSTEVEGPLWECFIDSIQSLEMYNICVIFFSSELDLTLKFEPMNVKGLKALGSQSMCNVSLKCMEAVRRYGKKFPKLPGPLTG